MSSIWWGAPYQQINTRASGHTSHQDNVKESSQLEEPDSQTILSLQDGKGAQEKKNTKKLAKTKLKPKPGNNLGYFSLWWRRMAREGMKEKICCQTFHCIIVIHCILEIFPEVLLTRWRKRGEPRIPETYTIHTGQNIHIYK